MYIYVSQQIALTFGGEWVPALSSRASDARICACGRRDFRDTGAEHLALSHELVTAVLS